jgi:hypothetical protein
MQADDLKIDVFGDVGIATFVLNYSFKAKPARSKESTRHHGLRQRERSVENCP